MSALWCGGSRTIAAYSDLSTVVTESLVVPGKRFYNTGLVEACYFHVKADTDNYRDGSEIYLYLNSSTTASMKVFSGTDRRNATAAVHNNETAVKGAPIRVSTSNGGAIVVVYTNAPAVKGSIQFSHKVVGSVYKWFEFVPTPFCVHYLFLAAFSLALCLVIS